MADWGYTYLQNDEDRLWFDEGLRRGWELPAPAARLWRCCGIRHLRAFSITWKAYHDFDQVHWRELWHKEWVSYAISKGWV